MCANGRRSTFRRKEKFAIIADLRELSEEGVAIAAERGLLFCADSREGRAWVITDVSPRQCAGAAL